MKPCTTITLFRNLLTASLAGWLALASFTSEAQITTATNAAPRKSPAWLRSGVMYEIFPRTFSATGDFNGITARLDELKDLGVNILWIMPIHPLGQKMKKGPIGSPYCVRDFYAINPAYGTTNDFRRLVNQAHQRGMKIIMDIVAGHTSWDSVMMKHPDFYTKDANGHMHPPNPAWTDVAELNYSNPALRRYMINMLKYWVSNFHVDGFRCDTAYTVPIDFWEAARAELEKINPNIVIITDSGAKPALLSKAFDMDYSGNLYSTLNMVINYDYPATYLRQSWEHTERQFPKGALHLRYTDNHSTTRAVVRYGLEGALAAQVFILTLDGVPLFYNGMEVGDSTESADPALFERLPVFWHPGGRPPLRDIYRGLIKLRKEHPAFTNNDVIWLTNSTPGQVVSFLRRDAKDEYLVLINFSNLRADGSVNLPAGGRFKPVQISGWTYPVDIDLPSYELKGFDWLICDRAIVR